MKDVAVSPDGIPVTFETHGTGEPALVFVHGWSCDRSYRRGQVGDFARRHRVVTVDLAGHGESGTGRKRWTVPAFGADVAAVIEKLRVEDVILIGHSLGGDVIVETALLLPKQVAGVVWVDVFAPAVVGHLRGLSAPVVAINPDSRPTDVDGLRRHGVETVIMPGVAHFLMLEDPATFNRLLSETVARMLAG